MKLSNVCESYFSGFKDLSNYKANSKGENILATIKILSYFTVVIPMGFAALYGVASLFGRVSHKESLSSHDIDVKNQAHKALSISAAKVTKKQPAALYQKNATYETDGRGIDDIAYADEGYKFGYVVDGTGHGNEMMARVLNRIFGGFNKEYVQALKEAKPDSAGSYRAFLADQLNKLGNSIHGESEPVEEVDPRRPGMTHMNDGTLKPALSFAQVAIIGDRRVLFSAQYSDTMLLIKKAHDIFDVSLAKSKTDYGVGESHTKAENIIGMSLVDEGDIIYGFSDGIGEFLTMAECQEVILNNTDPTQLLSDFKAKIMAKGVSFRPRPDRTDRENGEISANGKRLKFHSPTDKQYYDDIALFILRVK